jgi:hypothetical protein
MTTERMMLGWENFAEAATITSATPAQADRGVTNVIARRIARTFMAQESSRREMSIALDLGLTYSQALARVITLTRHVLGTRGRFRIQAGNVADLGEPDLLLDFLSNTLDDRITFTRASTAAYWDADGVMQFAATDTARFDHHPVTGARRGLLVEGAGTNLWSRSQEIDHGDWTKSGARVVPNVGVAPDGTTTADLLIEDGSGASAHFLSRSYTKAASAITYTDSLFVKPAGRFTFQISADDGVGNGCYAAFDVSAGRVTTEAAGLGTPFTAFKARIRRLRNGWYRCSLSYTTNTATTLQVAHYMTNGSTSYDGNTLSGLLMWGFQLEASSFPTSYIPTTSAAASRSADIVSNTGTDFSGWHVAGPLTVRLAAEPIARTTAQPYLLQLSDGSFNNRIFVLEGVSGATYRAVVSVSGTTQADLSQTLAGAGHAGIALAAAGNDFALSVGGRTAGTDTTGSLPTVSRMDIGSDHNGNNHFAGWIRSLECWTWRLADARLAGAVCRGATINTDFAACDVDLPVEYTFTRASGGGYVDALGRLQGQYPAITAPIVPQTTREERVKNGGFDSDSLWTKGTGWTIGSGVATKSAGTGSNLAQTIPTVPGQVYRIRATVTRSAGSVVVDAGGTDLVTVSADGSVSQTFTATATTTAITFEADATFAGTVDNVSVTLDTGLRVPVGAGQDVKVGQLLRIEPQDATANTYMLGKVVAYDGAIVTVDVVEAAAPELADGGHFTSTAGGFTMGGGTQAVVSGELEITSDGSTAYGGATDAVTLAVGATYVFEGEIRVGTAANVRLLFDYGSSLAASGSVTTSTAVRHILVATADGTAGGVNFQFVSAPPSAGHTAYGDNMSLKRAHTAWIVSLAGPRFTHDTDGTALGLLVEPAATNLLLRSQEFDNAWWTKGASTISANAAVAPNGETTADKLVESGTTSAFTVQRPPAVTGSHTFSVFAKAAERTWLSMRFTGTTNSDAYFNLSTGAVGTSSGCTASVVDFGDGWYRCIVTATVAGIGDQVVIRLASANNTALYAGDGSSGAYIWGAQIEAGSVATSYIPTFGVTRSRSADVCTIEGDEFTARVRQDAGTMLVGFRFNDGGVSTNRYPATIESNGDNRHGVLVVGGSNLLYADIREAGVNQATWIMLNNAVAGTEYTAALAYSATSSNTALDGTAGTEDTSATIPTTSQITFGHRAGLEWMVGTLPRFVYFPERRSDADLVAMTTSGADLDAYTIPGTLADAYAGTYDSDWTKAWDGGHSATAIGSQEPTLRHILDADIAYRYWRLDLYDHPGPDADPAGADDAVTLEGGYLGLWRVWQPAYNPEPGAADGLDDPSIVIKSWAGSEDIDVRTLERVQTYGWPLLELADARTFREIEEYSKISAPMYFLWNPGETDDWIFDDMLCRFERLSQIQKLVVTRFAFAIRLKRWTGAPSS